MALPKEPTLTSNPTIYAKMQTTPLNDFEKAGLERTAWFRKHGFGYYNMQATKPQTIGYSITDSPVGLLSWIYEKLHDWTDAYPWTDDEVLTWVSIYYFSEAGPAATQRIYYDNDHRDPPAFETSAMYIDNPLGIMRVPKEIVLLPKVWHETMGPVVQMAEFERGGHFAAWEVPDLLVGEVRRMFGKGGGAEGCVRGRNGFNNEEEASKL